MITWLTGNSEAGKTTLAKKMIHSVMLDADDMRKAWPELGFTSEDRRTNNLRIAHIAMALEKQGLDVVVATICPIKELREEIKKLTKCRFVYLEGGDERGYSYEI